MRRILLCGALIFATASATEARMASKKGLASWYGEAHRGKLMANGKKFNPDRLTAASWFYPLGTKVRVTARASDNSARTVLVTVTDRGPAHDLVGEGRIIDLTHAAYKRLAHPDLGLVPVSVQPANHP
jgi:rare lipoprotein A